MRFADIPGLEEVKKRLIQAVKAGHVAHAQLFLGREGALNLPLALAYATYLQCTDRGDDACGVCASCSKNQKFIHPDTHFVFPAGNVKGDKDEERFRADLLKMWRQFLLEQPFGNLADWSATHGGEDKQLNISREESRNIIRSLSLKPFESHSKVMIIWQPEFMHPSAANGILKILEEPPAQTFFILVSNNPERLLPTILSRTQQVMVPMLSDEALAGYLKTLDLKAHSPARLATAAGGNLRLAVELASQDDADDTRDQLARWLRSCYKRDVSVLLEMMDTYHEADRLRQQEFLVEALNVLRESLVFLSGSENLMRSSDNDRKFVTDFSKVMNVGRIEKCTRLIQDAAVHLERNGSAKMIFLDLSMNISRVLAA